MLLALILLVAAVALWPVHPPPQPRAQGWRSPKRESGTVAEDVQIRRPGPWTVRPRRTPGVAEAQRTDQRAQHAELVTVGLEAGLGQREAWALAVEASSAKGSRGLERSVREDFVVPRTTKAHLPEHPPDLLDRALTLSALVGTPAAAATRAAADHLRERARALRRRDTLLAGPRASMTVLALLPIVGPVATAALGLPLAEVYAVGWAPLSCGVGLGLTVAGWLIARAMVRKAARPGLLPGPARR